MSWFNRWQEWAALTLSLRHVFLALWSRGPGLGCWSQWRGIRWPSPRSSQRYARCRRVRLENTVRERHLRRVPLAGACYHRSVDRLLRTRRHIVDGHPKIRQ